VTQRDGDSRARADSARARARHNTRDATMSDDEHDVETFESADAGASHTVPMQAGSVRKGGFMVRATTRDARRDGEARSRDGGERDARGETRARATRAGTMGKKCARAKRARAGEGRARAGEGRGARARDLGFIAG